MKKIMIAIQSVTLLFLALVTPLKVVADKNFQDQTFDDNVFLSEYVQNIFEEGSVLPVSQVKSVLQTSDRYIWVAGYQGLMRYNGMDTKIFTESDGFPTMNVNKLFEDSQKRLWIGTNDNGLVMYDKQKFHIFGTEHGMTSLSVRDIIECEDGNIVVATTSGLAVISNDLKLTIHDNLKNEFITNIVYAGEKKYYALLNSGDMLCIEDWQITNRTESTSFGEFSPVTIYFANNNVLYIGTSGNTIIIADNNMNELKTISTSTLQNIKRICQDKSSDIWVCSDNGIGYIKNGKFFVVDGLKINNSIECLFEDYEGNYWIGSSRQGLLQLVKSRFRDISFDSKLPEYTVNTTTLWNNNLYIGADEGLIILQNDYQIQNELTDLLNGTRIRCIFNDSKDRLWICTYEKYGVVLVEKDGTYKSITSDDGLASNKVCC